MYNSTHSRENYDNTHFLVCLRRCANKCHPVRVYVSLSLSLSLSSLSLSLSLSLLCVCVRARPCMIEGKSYPLVRRERGGTEKAECFGGITQDTVTSYRITISDFLVECWWRERQRMRSKQCACEEKESAGDFGEALNTHCRVHLRMRPC